MTDLLTLPRLGHLLASARVVSLPMATRFRGIERRESMLIPGPLGWTEFSPFIEYDDSEASAWLAGALDFGWTAPPLPPGSPSRIFVNATLPAVDASLVEGVLSRFPGCRTVKVKVAESGQPLESDVERVARTRELLGPDGRIRVDANGGWNVDEAEHAIHDLARYDLEYVEQPCATVDELADIRKRIKYMGIPIAADESVRKAEDPLAVARAGAADILIIKVQPLGGVARALRIVAEAGLPAVVSSALESSVGLSMGAHLAASLPGLELDCGLGTAALLAADLTHHPLLPLAGRIDVRRVDVDEEQLERYAASEERTNWWMHRLERVYAVLAQG